MARSKLKDITGWDWETLTASWRYFEYRQTISSSMFPAKIVERFWRSGKWSDKAKQAIAYQFAHVDHGPRGEEDWPMDCGFGVEDARTWLKFYGFCRAWSYDRFETVRDHNGRDIKCFRANGRLYPVDEYIARPLIECWVDESKLKGAAK